MSARTCRFDPGRRYNKKHQRIFTLVFFLLILSEFRRIRTIDVLPVTSELTRHFSFRFIKIEVMNTSPEYQIKIMSSCKTETSANPKVFVD
ncbi:hypothetical protein [Enterococcus gallinarum]|uniref:hypothetical protein n=1 Tax=Enterococcus gallinarum TaxID=1353 RepID=UPI0034A4D859